MTKRQLSACYDKYVRPHAPGCVLQGFSIYCPPPSRYFLAYIECQTSAYSKDVVYARAEMYAFCVSAESCFDPCESARENSSNYLPDKAPEFGQFLVRRIAATSTWAQSLGVPSVMARKDESFYGRSPTQMEAVTGCRILEGDIEGAITLLRAILSWLEENRSPWDHRAQRMHDHVNLLLAALPADPERARRLLNQWRDETVANLGIEGLAWPSA